MFHRSVLAAASPSGHRIEFGIQLFLLSGGKLIAADFLVGNLIDILEVIVLVELFLDASGAAVALLRHRRGARLVVLSQ